MSAPTPQQQQSSTSKDAHTTSSCKPSTSSHAPVDAAHPDPTTTSASPTSFSQKLHNSSTQAPPSLTSTTASHDAQGRLTTASSSGAAELANLKIKLRGALRQFPDFPSPGILFEDILPIFADPALHAALVRALELHVLATYGADRKPDVVVGLEARGFLFGPSLALRLGAGFVPVRKKGKLPGETVTAEYVKEYGKDLFEMQADGIEKGQKVLIVDDIIATGGSAAAAGSLVKQLGGELMGYLFILELDFLKGREKLDASVYTLLTGQEEKYEG